MSLGAGPGFFGWVLPNYQKLQRQAEYVLCMSYWFNMSCKLDRDPILLLQYDHRMTITRNPMLALCASLRSLNVDSYHDVRAPFLNPYAANENLVQSPTPSVGCSALCLKDRHKLIH